MNIDPSIDGERAQRIADGQAVRVRFGIEPPCGTPVQAVVMEAEDELCWGSVWTRPRLPQKTRAGLAFAMTSALSQPEGIEETFRIATAAGWTLREIAEILVFVQCYAGLYPARTAARIVAGHPAAGTGPADPALPAPVPAPLPSYGAPAPSGLSAFGANVRRRVFGSKNVDDMLERTRRSALLSMFFDTTHEYNFGRVWAPDLLTRQMRSMLSLGICAVRGQPGAVRRHARSAIESGLAEEDVGEVLLLVYVYGGMFWSNACFFAAQEVFDEIAAERSA